jgi:hypothetical protein
MLKWFFTALMLTGACITSWKLHPYYGLFFLFAGNLGWSVHLFKTKEWAAMTVFVVMATTWGSGIIKYFLS